MIIKLRSIVLAFLLSVVFVAVPANSQSKSANGELWRDVEVVRTAHGVPHIRAKNLRAAGYALAWVQLEDYGMPAAQDVLEASGRWATVDGYQRVESDFVVQRQRDKTAKNYHLLSKDVREVYEGFAAGLNRYIEMYPGNFPANMPHDFTAVDVAATESIPPSIRKVRLFLNRMNPQPNAPQQQNAEGEGEGEGADEGSNAWAFAPSRTKSGKAILLRNPHLQWNAGYYEAHMTVPGAIDFYGDFRIGGPFTVIGGFNKDLGWATTNNAQDLDEFYALDVDPKMPDHYLIDGKSIALTRELRTVTFRNGDGLSSETREFWSTQFGPVVHRANGKIYILKFAGDGEYRAGEQFLRMMRASSLKEW
jgi:acyl-homoserine-lactone acylase